MWSVERRVYSVRRPSITLYYKACTSHLPVLLCTTKLAETTSQCYFVLQSLHKVIPSTTLYYKACTKHFPVLVCTTKFAQSRSLYYFVLQSLQKALPSTTLYYKACTKHVPSTTLYYKACTKSFPVLLCTTKLAQSRSQYYFVLQSLHKARSQYYFVLQSLHKIVPRTTLYYKACTKHFPVLLCTTKLARKTTWQPAWKPSKRRGFAASPIDTELTTRRRRDDDATSHSRRTRVQPPDPQTINGNPSLRRREKTSKAICCSAESTMYSEFSSQPRLITKG